MNLKKYLEIIPAQYLSVHTGRHFLLNGGIQTIVKKINVHNAYDVSVNIILTNSKKGNEFLPQILIL